MYKYFLINIGMTTFWLTTIVEQVNVNVDIEFSPPFYSFSRNICHTIIPLAIGLFLQFVCHRQHKYYAQITLKWISIGYIFSNILYTIVLDIKIFFSFPFPMFWLVSIHYTVSVIVHTYRVKNLTKENIY